MQANLATLESLNTQLRLNSDNQIRAAERRDSLTALLAEAASSPQAFGAAARRPAAAEPRAVRLARLRQELASARSRYTEEHPTVVRLKAEIAATEREPAEPAGDQGGAPAPSSSPYVLRLRETLSAAESEVKILKAEEQRLRAAIAAYQARVENTPKREQEFQEISRDYESTKQLYESLVKRHEEAQLAESMEQRQKGEQFRILDPAMPSQIPAAPNRLRLFIVSLVLSLGLAGGALMLAEMLDTSFHSAKELREFTIVPVLVSIPQDRDRGRSAAPAAAVPTRRGRDDAGAGSDRRRLLLHRARQRAARPDARGQRELRRPCRSTSPSSACEQKPFNPTPDPRFLYLTPGHREALAQLLYGVQEHKGFILLTGEVGTGKTTLLRTLCSSRLDGKTASAFVFNYDPAVRRAPGVHARGLRRRQARGVPRPAAHRPAQLPDRAAAAPARTPCSSSTRPRISTSRPSSRSGSSRTSRPRRRSSCRSCSSASRSCWTSWTVPSCASSSSASAFAAASCPLTAEQTRDYIRTRLRIAGARDLGLFSDAAITRIAEYSGGIPRLVNTLCDHCLLIAYADQIRRIDRADRRGGHRVSRGGRAATAKPRRPRQHLAPDADAAGACPPPARPLLGSVAALTIAHRDALRPVLDAFHRHPAGLAHAASSFLRQ